jgi:hypothetical protein
MIDPCQEGKAARHASEKRYKEISEVPQLAFVPLGGSSFFDIELDIASQMIELYPRNLVCHGQVYSHTMSLQTALRVGPHQLTVC